jgi:NTE family protein
MERALILSGGGARGAFQVGVLRYLQEVNWTPDMICGSSVGAVNASALGSGMSLDQIAHFWLAYERQKMFCFTPQKFIMSLLSRRKFSPMSDTSPLESLLESHVDPEALRRSRTKIVIAAVNMRTSQLTYFDQSEISVRHVMASSAIPMVFPWQFIDGEPYWDGVTLGNTPIMPALERGAKEIIAVLLSPVGAFPQPLPRTHMQVAELIFEQSLVSSYCMAVNHLADKKVLIRTVAPEQMLGFRSILNFTPGNAKRLIQEGYDSAKKQLDGFFNK